METLSSIKKCKKCDTGILEDRVKRPLLIKTLLFWLPVKRYKCDYCNKKSYLLDRSASHSMHHGLQHAH